MMSKTVHIARTSSILPLCRIGTASNTSSATATVSRMCHKMTTMRLFSSYSIGKICHQRQTSPWIVVACSQRLYSVSTTKSLRSNNLMQQTNNSLWYATNITNYLQQCSPQQQQQYQQQQQIRTLFGFGGGGGKNDKSPSPTPTEETTPAASVTNETIDDEKEYQIYATTTDDVDNMSSNNPSVDETLNKLFEEQSKGSSSASASTDSAWYSNTETTVATDASGNAIWDPTWYNVADNAILAINWIQQTTGLSYGLSIILATAILRVSLFPVMVQAQRAASRMAHVQPELMVLKARYERLVSPTMNDQKHFTTNMKALFQKYNVNPIQTIIAPLIQIPLFIGMFFGLKKVSTYFPTELQNGGMLWFTDLSVPDPYYALPLLSSATFLLLVEIGKDQMMQSGPSGAMMLNVFRFMCIVSLPLVSNFEGAMLLYWVTNNCLTISQTLILKAPYMRKQFGILEPPKPLPGTDPNKDGIVSSVTDFMKRAQGQPVTEIEKINKHNQAIEAKNVSTQLTRAAREREKLRRRRGITGTRNY